MEFVEFHVRPTVAAPWPGIVSSHVSKCDYQMLNLGMCQCASKALVSSFRALGNLGYETRSDLGGDRLQRSIYSS